MSASGTDGLRREISLLARIQRSVASGSLMIKGSGGGVLVFHGGDLVKAIRESGGTGSSPPSGEAGALRAEATSILTAGFGAPGQISFLPHEAESPPAASTPLNAGDLILDLARAATDSRWILEMLGEGCLVRPNTAPPPVMPRLGLGAPEGFLLSRADGTLTLGEILAVSPLGENETLAALHGLLASGLLSAPGASILDDAPGIPGAAQGVDPHGPARGASGSKSSSPLPKRSLGDLTDFLKRTTKPAASRAPAASAAGAPARGASSPTDLAAVEKRIADSRDADHYGVLGVEKTADENTIRRTYYKIAKRFHPDRFHHPEFVEIFPEIEASFAATTEAYNTLTDEKARALYDRQLAEAASGSRPPEMDTAAQAKESYARGRRHLDAEELFDAMRLFETACQLDSSKPDYWLHLGIVQTRNPRWRKKAEATLLKALELNPACVAACVHLARLYRAGGLARRSVEMFEKVLQWEPENEEALVETGRKKPEADAGTSRIRSLFKGPKA